MPSFDATKQDCPCGARSYQEILEGKYDRLGFEGFEFRILECKVCGLARTDPMPDVRLYETEEYQESGSFKGDLEDLWSISIASFIASKTKPGRVLNIGAHTGNLHPPLESHGYEVLGIDIDDSAVRVANEVGRNVRLVDLYEAGFKDGEFDIVTMIHTLEHLEHPERVIAECARLIRPGGALFINVPNRGGWLPKIMQASWIGWVPPHHVWQFTLSTLKDLVERGGAFQTQFLRGVGSMEPPSGGVKGLIKKALATTADRLGRGDQVVAIFQRR